MALIFMLFRLNFKFYGNSRKNFHLQKFCCQMLYVYIIGIICFRNIRLASHPCFMLVCLSDLIAVTTMFHKQTTLTRYGARKGA